MFLGKGVLNVYNKTFIRTSYTNQQRICMHLVRVSIWFYYGFLVVTICIRVS